MLLTPHSSSSSPHQVFGALAEYAFILRQIIYVSRAASVGEEDQVGADGRSTPRMFSQSLDGSGLASPQRAAVVALSDTGGNGNNGGGIAFKLNGGMEMREAAEAAEQGQPPTPQQVGASAAARARYAAAAASAAADPHPPSNSSRPRPPPPPRSLRPHPFVSDWTQAEPSISEACLGAPHGRHHRHQHLVHRRAIGQDGADDVYDDYDGDRCRMLSPVRVMSPVGQVVRETETSLVCRHQSSPHLARPFHFPFHLPRSLANVCETLKSAHDVFPLPSLFSPAGLISMVLSGYPHTRPPVIGSLSISPSSLSLSPFPSIAHPLIATRINGFRVIVMPFRDSLRRPQVGGNFTMTRLSYIYSLPPSKVMSKQQLWIFCHSLFLLSLRSVSVFSHFNYLAHNLSPFSRGEQRLIIAPRVQDTPEESHRLFRQQRPPSGGQPACIVQHRLVQHRSNQQRGQNEPLRSQSLLHMRPDGGSLSLSNLVCRKSPGGRGQAHSCGADVAVVTAGSVPGKRSRRLMWPIH